MIKARAEVYKGIEYVRLSALAADQAKSIRTSPFFANKTIKILRDNDLLSDCVPYKLYLEWYDGFSGEVLAEEGTQYAPIGDVLKLALK